MLLILCFDFFGRDPLSPCSMHRLLFKAGACLTLYSIIAKKCSYVFCVGWVLCFDTCVLIWETSSRRILHPPEKSSKEQRVCRVCAPAVSWDTVSLHGWGVGIVVGLLPKVHWQQWVAPCRSRSYTKRAWSPIAANAVLGCGAGATVILIGRV